MTLGPDRSITPCRRSWPLGGPPEGCAAVVSALACLLATDSYCRLAAGDTIAFAGHTWRVRSGQGGPGPNGDFQYTPDKPAPLDRSPEP